MAVREVVPGSGTTDDRTTDDRQPMSFAFTDVYVTRARSRRARGRRVRGRDRLFVGVMMQAWTSRSLTAD
jgi:hypothetical protein